MIAALLAGVFAAPACGQERPARVPQVWFGPAPSSPDYLKLFTEPAAWSRARARVNAFLFSPSGVDASRSGEPNSLADLTRVDAFRKLQDWGISSAIEAPAIKEWDCTGRKPAAMTEQMIANVVAAGGSVALLSLDGPLASGFGRNPTDCHLSLAETAARLGDYARTLLAVPSVAARGKALEFLDIEPYPSFGVDQLEAWLVAADARGFRPAGLTLDVNLDFVKQSAERKSRLIPDLRALQRALRRSGIAFGIILWSGHDPIRTDREYYDYVMDWANTVHRAIGRPDYVVFESWVTRCPLDSACAAMRCSAADPSYCGKKSVPLNLAGGERNAYAHTRLIEDATNLLNGK